MGAIKKYVAAEKELDNLIRTALSQRVINIHPSPLLWWRIKRQLYPVAPPSFLHWQLFLPALEKARAHSLSLGYSTHLL